MLPYQPRPTRFLGVRHWNDWRLKHYAISVDGSALDGDAFDEGISLARAALPQPAQAPGRPGVGFLIAHHGAGGDYAVLGWWDHENELPVRVFVRMEGEGRWRAAGTESFCVWDLEVIWAEREAYVETVLSARPDVGAYLARHHGESA